MNKEKLLDAKNHNVKEEEDVEHMKFDGIDIATWEKQNRLRIVQQEYRLEVKL